MVCDCGADAEDVRAGMHNEPCDSTTGEPDHPSDHYGQ